MPLALAAATRLTHLSLSNNLRLVLTGADIDSVLSRLPHLRRLDLDVRRMPPHVNRRLVQRLPQLRILEVP